PRARVTGLPRTVPAAGPPILPTLTVIVPSLMVRTASTTSVGSPIDMAERYVGPRIISQMKPAIPQNVTRSIRRDIVVEVRLGIDAAGNVAAAEAAPGSDVIYLSLARISV